MRFQIAFIQSLVLTNRRIKALYNIVEILT